MFDLVPVMRSARDFSYAHTMPHPLLRALVRIIENATGRVCLIRRARGYEAELAAGRDFWSVMVERLGLTVSMCQARLDTVPRTGPLVVVANHPFGVLDGLMMGHLLHSLRGGQYRILANEVFSRAPELQQYILPIDFAETPEAARKNIDTRKEALRFLAEGGAIGVFPGGTVSTPARPFGQAMDPEWRRFTAKMVARSKASVVPVFFEGQNSRLFQVASHYSVPLRMGLLLHEIRAKMDRPVQVEIGPVLTPDALAPFAADAKSMMDFLREQTYGLSTKSLDWRALGHDFEKRTKT